MTASTKKVKIVAKTPNARAKVSAGFQPMLRGAGRGSEGLRGRNATVRVEYSSQRPLLVHSPDTVSLVSVPSFRIASRTLENWATGTASVKVKYWSSPTDHISESVR